MTPIIDQELCVGCSTCDDICPNDMFAMAGSGKAYVTGNGICAGCQECVVNCEGGAISFCD